MCGRDSRLGARSIVVFFLLLLLSASPLFAAASWGGLLHGGNTGEASECPTQPSTESVTESSLDESTMQLQTSDKRSLRTLEKQLERLKEEYANYETLGSELDSLLQKLKIQLEDFKQTEKITEEDYLTTRASLIETVKANNKQADYIAHLEKEAGSKGYGMINLLVGFEGLKPTYGVGLTLGMRVGSSLMLQAGADYTIGNFVDNPLYDFSLDNLSFKAGIGWMF